MHPSRFLAIVLLSICALLTSGHVPPASADGSGYDFSTRPFQGGNTDWTIRLVRISPGQVVYTLQFTSRPAKGDGLLESVKPEFGRLGLKGKYGLASAEGVSPSIRLMIAPSAADAPCQDRRGTRYPHAILLLVGDSVLYGCGDYDG
ncbi:hypothetical protein [Marilutibacter chinensis]|uniref:Uncharacterized protein n=1 Tax=Marilutibacter chinensis TaxID=2912247 RepID=A0ABS9HYF4_9GAMM|nr:hypothetical protein [Lysobacter chinensis]MCF7223586.1 hypothetical protein [Lysobacter chinensis]